jgi:hypothetical protein
MADHRKVSFLCVVSFLDSISQTDQFLPLSSAFVKMNSVHNEIVIWSSLVDPHVLEKGRGIHWICLWNNFSTALRSHTKALPPQQTGGVHEIVIDRLQKDVIEWRQRHRTASHRLPSHTSRRLLPTPPDITSSDISEDFPSLPLLLILTMLLLFLLSRRIKKLSFTNEPELAFTRQCDLPGIPTEGRDNVEAHKYKIFEL